MNVAYNRDCLEAMKEFPDKYFDLAVVDPPYGDGSANSQSVNVESITIGSVEGLTDTKVSRTGGKWAAKFGKNHKLGLRPQRGILQRTF